MCLQRGREGQKCPKFCLRGLYTSPRGPLQCAMSAVSSILEMNQHIVETNRLWFSGQMTECNESTSAGHRFEMVRILKNQ